jgi:hypothetical protein
MTQKNLEQYEDNWQTSMGGILFDQGLVSSVLLRGRDIFTELSNKTWMEYQLFAVTGREDPILARLIEAIWVISSSYPEPRLWNNRVAALAGTARSTGHLAVAGAVAVTEAGIYGGQPILRVADFLSRTHKQLQQGLELQQVLDVERQKTGKIYGYGRPGPAQDERIQPLLNYIEEAGIERGSYTELVFAITEHFDRSKHRLQPNIAALLAGLLLDQGLSAKEIYYLYILGFCGGFLPCFLDAQAQPQGALFPLRSGRINYRGTAPRQWSPRAK